MKRSLVSIGVVLLATGRAYGYIDPGTTSYILQIAIAGILGAAFALKVFWGRIVTFLKGRFGRKKDGSCEG